MLCLTWPVLFFQCRHVWELPRNNGSSGQWWIDSVQSPQDTNEQALSVKFYQVLFSFCRGSRYLHHIFFSCHGQTKTSEDFLGIQIASDLHIEFYGELGEIPKDIIVPSAPVLALVGDISLVFTDLLRDFLWQQTDRFEEVLFVAGNHEFYNVRGDTKTIEEQWQWLEEVCSKRKNLHLLEKKSIEIKGVKILGTALWSHIPKDVQPRAASSLNDYHICFTNVSTVIATHEIRKLQPLTRVNGTRKMLTGSTRRFIKPMLIINLW